MAGEEQPADRAGLEGPDVSALEVHNWTIPTDQHESDGTLEWDSTTIVVVEARAGGRTGLGYTYAHPTVAEVIRRSLAPLVLGSGSLSVHRTWRHMVQSVRNTGRPGLVAQAISAVDTALWDLKARLLEVPLVQLFDSYRDDVALYGSGGFTSYDTARLQEQMTGWVEDGFSSVKMKVGREPGSDPSRVEAVRAAVGEGVEVMVDANGAYPTQQALALGRAFGELGVTWYEEPVSSDDLNGLRFVREHTPPGMEVTAGEYGYDPWYFQRMLSAGAVDVLQADATRCLGYTGFLAAAELCRAGHVAISAHTAPQLHAHVAAAAPSLRHIEYFHDHVRIEEIVFDGTLAPTGGRLTPGRDRPGHGLTLKRADADRAAV